MNVPIQIRFADIDMMGIVHNVVYFHYFEQARLAYFLKGLGENWDWQKEGFVVAKNQVDYKFPLVLSDKPYVKVKVENIGSKSFELSYEVLTLKKEKEHLHAVGSSVIVCLNNLTQSTIEIPQKIRLFLEENS